MSDKEEFGLVEGWRYAVTTDKDPKSKGEFKGYVMIGSESAIVLQMSEGITRMIPVTRIVHIDSLGSGERRKIERNQESVYYG